MMKQLGFMNLEGEEKKRAAPKPKARRAGKKKAKAAVHGEEAVRIAGEEKRIWKVGEFLDHWNDVFAAETFTVEGEVSDAHEHPTGLYFTLKDGDGGGILDCYMNPYLYRRLGLALEAGLVVRATGVPNIYKQKGRFSFRVETLVLSGEGSLRQAYELLKKKLEAEGLFARKRPLPEFIGRIGVITSRTGAVIDDFRKNLKPLGFELFFKDVRVEGASAPDQIIEAIRLLNRGVPDLDAIVLIRGGGSLEDMQPFNNENVARAVFASAVPVIAGIGHDRDVPITSLVADRDTSTPSIAALAVNASWDRAFAAVPVAERDLLARFEGLLKGVAATIDLASEKMVGRLSGLVTRYKDIARALREGLSAAIENAMNRLAGLEKSLALADPERNLRLGYSLVFGPENRIVRDASLLKKGDPIRTRMYRGEVESKVEKVTEKGDNYENGQTQE